MFLTFVVAGFRRKAAVFLGITLVGLIIFGAIFYRDPKRIIPLENDIVISPADGKVISIDTVYQGDIPFTVKDDKRIYLPELKEYIDSDYTIVSIFMGPFDVHVNRSPISGEVVDIIYIEGKYLPAFGDVLGENERNIIVIDGKIRVVTIQIAGTFARRINCYVDLGQTLNRGDKIGMIKLGSQVVLIYPSKINTIVKVGDKVKAGESIIGAF